MPDRGVRSAVMKQTIRIEPTVAKIKAEIEQQEETVKALKAGGHIVTDAERQLHELKQSLSLFSDRH
jgi:hypothetical protein